MPSPTPLLIWIKATASGTGGCVEIAATPEGGVAIRDSKDRNGAILNYTAREWHAFLSGVKDGEFDSLV